MNNLISNLPAFPNLDQLGSTPASSVNEGEGNFGALLKTAINQVEELHGSAAQQVTDLLKGNRSDVHNVMIAVEKADIAFQLMLQVRNKIVSAYQEVSRMQF
ncbi:MAG: flagellar hook-basal body complex protein FliE [Acidobacteriia bacterium]|nr:flagellar hook-basal body complex protein FliE [Terriglobia bacterium]